MDIKEEYPVDFTEYDDRDRDRNIKFETVTCTNIVIKREIEEPAVVSDLCSQNGGEFVPQEPVTGVKKYDSDDEIYNKVEIKPEPVWFGNESKEDGEHFTPVILQSRASSEASSFAEVSGCGGSEQEQYHHLTPKGKKTHKCNVCDKSFTKLSDMKRHSLIHEGIKPYKCTVCQKNFTQLSSLNLHNLIHEGLKPHKCTICDKNFTRLAGLRVHNLIHEGKKPHKCETCDKSFTRLRELKVHNLIHEGVKPHKCKICDRGFTQLSNFKRHNLIHQRHVTTEILNL